MIESIGKKLRGEDKGKAMVATPKKPSKIRVLIIRGKCEHEDMKGSPVTKIWVQHKSTGSKGNA